MFLISKNFVLAYTFLVLLPLVGLAGILKSGRRLTAPASIDGVWSLQLDSGQLDSQPCGRVLAALPDKAIVISQSGRSFILSAPGGPKVTGSGTLDGVTLRASLIAPPESSFETSCGSGRQLSLLATIDRNADPASLVGTLSVGDCPACASVGFQATRSAPATTQGGH